MNRQQPDKLQLLTRSILYALGALMAGLVLMGAVAPAQSAQHTMRLQPVLDELAQRDPEARISVIVQKLTQDNAVEARVAELGGVVTKDLSIINAFAAELPAGQAINLAARPDVRWVSFDGPVQSQIDPGTPVDTSRLANAYIQAIGADRVWNEAPYNQGQGITVAVVDSGVSGHQDVGTRVVARAKFVTGINSMADTYSHGTHVAGLIGGDGSLLSSKYIGVAPRVNFVSIKVNDDAGQALESDVVSALQWVYTNYATYNIRVVNLSLTSTQAQSYHTSPMDAAMEILWLNRIVVVTAAGNSGTAALYPPANDPFVITVGATDDRGTPALGDDEVTPFSAYGTTGDGFAKPDLVAPGKNLISALASGGSYYAKTYPERIVDSNYFRASGTSAAAAVTTGAVALLLAAEPDLTPDQVKYRLMATADKSWPGYDPAKAGAGHLDIYTAVKTTTRDTANTGVAVSHLLTTGPDGVLSQSVQWDSVQWNSVQWNSVQWNSDYWGP